MPNKSRRLRDIVLMALLALWALATGPNLVSCKTVTSSQESSRDAKARQDADRRATEILRQKILSDSAAKFEERQRTYGNNNDVNYSWNRKYRGTSNRYSNNRYTNNRYSNNQYTNNGNNQNQQYKTANTN